MKKILFVSHTANFARFNRAFMQWFQEQGWLVHYASIDEVSIPFCDDHFKIPFHRSPYHPSNSIAYYRLKKLLSREHYDIIHCHTPMGGVIARLAARKTRKQGTKVLYTAHGFHFFKGAPTLNWLLYYTMEKRLARSTDCLIVMNDEDYTAATDHHFRVNRIEKINGVGVCLTRFFPPLPEEKSQVRQSLGLSDTDKVLICVAEFSLRKNQLFLLKAMPHLLQRVPDVKLVLVGVGKQFSACKEFVAAHGLTEQVLFTGYRCDVERLYRAADILVSVSRQEGLPVNVIEGMASGLPVVCTAIRGQVDVIKNGTNGFLVELDDEGALCETLISLLSDREQRTAFGAANLRDVSLFSQENARDRMAEIYRDYL